MNIEQIVNRLAKLIGIEFKTEIRNRYDICPENNEFENNIF